MVDYFTGLLNCSLSKQETVSFTLGASQLTC